MSQATISTAGALESGGLLGQGGQSLSVLVVEDNLAALGQLGQVLESEGHQPTLVPDGLAAATLLEKWSFDLVLTSPSPDPSGGVDVLALAKQLSPATEVVILTGPGYRVSEGQEMCRGAFCYLRKPVGDEVLRHTVRQVAEKLALVARVRELEGAGPEGFPAIVGNSAQTKAIKQLIRQISDSDSNVLITGGTGTGKELVARAIHQSSRRRGKKLLAINCASLTDELIANELFGHEKEAFTGATGPRAGLLEGTDGGTLFLDEVGDMSCVMQAKILRVIQEREFIRVGGTEPVPVDVRIISATNRDLKKLAAGGSFRTDLYFRLKVIGIFVPDLSERREDIPLLANSFLRKCVARSGGEVVGFSRPAMALLMQYGYPGNVRELENIVECAASMARGHRVEVQDLPPDLTDFDSRTYHATGSSMKTLREVQMDYITWVLERVGGKRTEAARILGIDRASLYRKLKRAGVSGSSRKQS